MSHSPSSPGSRLPCLVRPARASHRWSICCRASTNTPSGRILLDGVELTDYSRAYLRKQIGIVEQEPFLFSRSIRENITYGVGRDVSQEEVERAAKAAAVHDVIMGFPDGYNTLVGEKGVTLSGGQKQRVTIARTLLKNPRILILDDSTSSVDTETEAEIRDALNELMENRTTFIIAHRIQSVMIADLILVLDKGEVIQMGTHEELVSQMDGMYRRIYDIQTRRITAKATSGARKLPSGQRLEVGDEEAEFIVRGVLDEVDLDVGGEAVGGIVLDIDFVGLGQAFGSEVEEGVDGLVGGEYLQLICGYG